MVEIKSWATKYISQSGFEQVEKAIAEAESHTSGEIVPILVRRSSTIGHVPIILACLFLISYFLLGIESLQEEFLGSHPLWFLLDILLALILGFTLGRIGFLQRLLTSSDDMSDQVDMRSEVEFYEAGLNRTKDATGILIFVSLMEHRATVLADRAITEKMPKETWTEVVNLVLDGVKKGDLSKGFSDAITRCGEILKPEFPIQSDDTNELKDHLIIKD